jgi:hypothetical protein
LTRRINRVRSSSGKGHAHDAVKKMGKSKGPSRRDDKFTPLNFTVSFDVYPQVAMIRENALELAQKLSAHHEWTDIHMSDEAWEFTRRQPRQGHAGGAIKVAVGDQEVKIEHLFPNGGLERFEILVDQVIEAIEQVIGPQILLGTSASLEYMVELGGDSREAILGALKLPGEDDELDKLAVFNRPCQFVGLRLGFPPYQITKGDDAEPGEEPSDETGVSQESPSGEQTNEEPLEGADWAATLTFQSQPDDPKKLSVEVDGRWMQPVQWKEVPKVIGNRLRIVDDFLKTKISEFLKNFRSDT